MLIPRLLTKVGMPRVPAASVVRYRSSKGEAEDCGPEKADCAGDMEESCDQRDPRGLSGGECVTYAVKSPMDALWYNHKIYFPRIKQCFRITSRPSDYRPGEDPNSNHKL